ncbi:MAG TPA: hypothetical protein VJ023_12030 [Pyrinomonadaceae bacterium]|nr:hypothetical protein [Pyrinomonadaceae bacterium]
MVVWMTAADSEEEDTRHGGIHYGISFGRSNRYPRRSPNKGDTEVDWSFGSSAIKDHNYESHREG